MMRDDATDPCARTKKRQVAKCLEAIELAGPPVVGTTEEPMTIVDSVASNPIMDCHQAEEFVSLDVVGE